MRRAKLVPLPKYVFSVGKAGSERWYYQLRRGKPDHGKLFRLPGGPTHPEFWSAYHAAAGGLDAVAGSITAVVAEYKTCQRWLKMRPASQKLFTISLNRVIAVWGDLRPEQITVAAIAEFRDTMTAPTAKATLGAMQGFFRFCAERGYCTTNPVRDVSRPDSDPEAGARPIPEKAYQHVMEHAPEAVRKFFILGRETGQRISDIVQMRPQDRDGSGIVLTITKRRRDREHWIPLSPKGLVEIDSWEGFPAAPYLTTEKGRPFTPDRFRKVWNEWVSLPENKVCAGIHPHDLRATAVCDDRLAGIPHQQVSARRGMSVQMVMHYSRHIDQRLAAGADLNEVSTKVKSARNNRETSKGQTIVMKRVLASRTLPNK